MAAGSQPGLEHRMSGCDCTDPCTVKRILFHSDDLGRTTAINAAVAKAHREGLLHSASLMVTGDAFPEAVKLAKVYPSLKVGLHLTLSEAAPALPPEAVPDLVGADGRFHRDPAMMGMRMALCSRARAQAALEIAAQFQNFMATGLPPAHVDGHHHLHMHPFVFRECLLWARKLGFPRIRIAREGARGLPPRRDGSGFVSKFVRHWVFVALARSCRRRLAGTGVTSLDGVLGLWETGRMSEAYLLDAIPRLPPGDWEVYTHVGSEDADEELPALLSPKLREMIERDRIGLL